MEVAALWLMCIRVENSLLSHPYTLYSGMVTSHHGCHVASQQCRIISPYQSDAVVYVMPSFFIGNMQRFLRGSAMAPAL